MKQKTKDKDMELWKINLQRQLEERYKERLSSKIGNLFENTSVFFGVCLAIIFQPLNLVIIGIFTILIILLI